MLIITPKDNEIVTITTPEGKIIKVRIVKRSKARTRMSFEADNDVLIRRAEEINPQKGIIAQVAQELLQ